MAAPREYLAESREGAVGWVVDARCGPQWGGCRQIDEQLGTNSETVRGWVMQAGGGSGHGLGTAEECSWRGWLAEGAWAFGVSGAVGFVPPLDLTPRSARHPAALVMRRR